MHNDKVLALRTADEYLYNLISGINDIVDLIQEGNEIEGIKKFIPALDGIDYISQIITLTEDIHEEKISLVDLNNQLKEIIDAFENEDYILLGDLLNYELIPVIKDIHNKIQKLI